MDTVRGRSESRLHSRYQPLLEAERYIEGLHLDPQAQAFLLIGPAEGYLFSVLRKRFPSACILGIQLERGFEQSPHNDAADSIHVFQGSQALLDFLDDCLRVDTLEAFKIIQWMPSLRSKPEEARAVLKILKTWTERLGAGSATEKAFGRRWLSNALRSLSLIHSQLVTERQSCPIVVACAGPSLEETIEEILAPLDRKDFVLLAVASAAQALYARDIEPDLVISSDGGNWARCHLEESSRRGIPIIYQLGAMIPSNLEGQSLLVCSNGSAWQRALLEARALESPAFIQRGTVSALAQDIALSLGSREVYMAGLDLKIGTIQTHARPHGFDHLAWMSESRTRPLWHWHEERRLMYRRSRALDIYADWFRTRDRLDSSRSFLLSSSGVSLYGMAGSSQVNVSTASRGLLRFKRERNRPAWPPSAHILVEKIWATEDSERELSRLLGLKGTGQTGPESLESCIEDIIASSGGSA